MNIVQSFWTHPLSFHRASPDEPYCGGWLSEKHHAISWLFSLNQLKKYHKEKKISLLTDKAGESWLINRLGLEYDNVSVEMDVLNSYDIIFWCLGKVYAYSRQQEPFIHVDGDIYVWEPLDTFAHSKKMLVQNFEINHPMYRAALDDARVSNITVPHYIEHLLTGGDVVSANLGVMGCTDMELMQEFCRVSFDFVNSNQQKIVDSEEKGNHNMLYEQLLLTQMMIQQNGKESIATVIPDEFGQVAGLTRFGLTPRKVKYVHMIGISKAQAITASHLEYRFAYEYPDAYRHIRQLYPEPPLYYILNGRMSGAEGQCPDFSKKEPFFASKLFLSHTHPGLAVTDESVIEELLEEHFDDPAYFGLWDIYQVESFLPRLEKIMPHIAGMQHWPLLYETDVDEFMKMPFMLNKDVCQVIYLYHNWKGGLYKNNIIDFANGSLDLPVNQSGQPLPWLIIQTPEYVNLVKANDWFVILTFMDEGITGEAILEQLAAQGNVQTITEDLKQDVFAFLSAQLHVHHTIIPAGEAPATQENYQLSKQERCS